MVELHLEGEAGLEIVGVAVLEHRGRELGVARDLGLRDLEPGLHRAYVLVGAADAERADVVEEEVRPVLAREQHELVEMRSRHPRAQRLEPRIEPIALLDRRGIAPGHDARGMTHGAGEGDRHGQASRRIAAR